ncbi:MAG: acetylornithine/succinylornithine family transaminase [Ruminococcaceae bacterium]|nr:acetylornithine/succinylornithine family transaminase [Oscillospiraceae bacterium]
MSNFEKIQQTDKQYVANTYGRFPVAIEKGKGATCYDFDGKKYIDFSSGIGVNSLGFCDEGWVEAVTKQLTTLQHISNLYYTSPCAEAAKLLCERTGMKKVFFSNSGAESNEGAIKCARKYSLMKYGEGRSKILTLNNSFHGRTVTTLAATGQDVFHNFFFPFTEGFEFTPANDPDALKKALEDSSVCALMMEVIQGEGGVMPLDEAFVKEAERLCREKDILLIIDEVQTGVGRTGKLFAFEHYGISPDIVTTAKGLGGGLPLGCVMFGERTENVLVAGDHATTFGGNPVATAGAKYILEKMDAAFLDGVAEKGEYIRSRLEKMPHVLGCDGKGMMIGVRLDSEVKAADIVKKGIENGVLALTAKVKLRLLPPLTITFAEIDEGLDAIEKALEEI